MMSCKTVLAFVFLALLAGCSKPCPRPGDVTKVYSEGPIHSCLYQLTVTEIDLNNYLIKAKLPQTIKEVAVEERYKDNEHKHNYGQETVELKKYYENKGELKKSLDDEYIFRVRDLDKLANKPYPYGITTGQTYYFLRDGHSPYLELFPGDPRVDE